MVDTFLDVRLPKGLAGDEDLSRGDDRRVLALIGHPPSCLSLEGRDFYLVFPLNALARPLASLIV